MLGTGGRKRSQKSCGQISKPHESELNSQTPQLSAHGRIPWASSLPLVQAPEGARPPQRHPRADGQGGAGVRVASVPALWAPPAPAQASSLPIGPEFPSPNTPSVLWVGTAGGNPWHLLFPLDLQAPHLLRPQQGARKDTGSEAGLVQLRRPSSPPGLRGDEAHLWWWPCSCSPARGDNGNADSSTGVGEGCRCRGGTPIFSSLNGE